MKYFFFVNPVAGTGKDADQLVERIHKYMVEINQAFNYQVVITRGTDDGIIRARQLAMDVGGEEARFFVAGGDGAANEVLNGIIDNENVSLGIIPMGTGNDAVRNFPEAADFLSLRTQINGDVKKVDILKYTGIINGKEQSRYCLNMFNIGFDCNVVEMTNRLKSKPLIAGSFAYKLAVAGMFIKKKGTSLTIKKDGEIVKEGDMLLAAICNGAYCGGGIKSNPIADVTDGLLELNIIDDVSRLRFLRLFPSFQKGEHLSIPIIKEVVSLTRGKEVEILPYKDKEITICVDGEIQKTEGMKIEVLPGALNFIVPRN